MNCKVEEGAYNAPIPWIGLYITAASIACLIATLVDLILGFCHGKSWLPCKIFFFNATSLMLLVIASKIPVDLSTPMLGVQEQFIKLTGTTLVCTCMANFMPSLGAIEDSQIILNVVPLAILVITIIVNICTQMGTGVVHDFIPEHIITLAFMLIELLITCSSALAVPSMKRLLKQQYELKHQQLLQEYELQHQQGLSEWPDNVSVRSMLETLKSDAKKYWLMALTCDPQYVLSRSCLCRFSGYCRLLEVCVCIEALVRMLKRVSVHVCKNSSHYKWSITCIWVSQVLAVAVGSFSAMCRRGQEFVKGPGSSSVEDRDTRSSGFKECNEIRGIMGIKVERFWIQTLEEWTDTALPFDVGSRRCRRLIQRSKNLFLKVTRLIQIAVVVLSKYMCGEVSRKPSSTLSPDDSSQPTFLTVLRRSRATFLTVLRRTHDIRTKARVLFPSSTDSSFIESLDFPATRRELGSFVVHLEGEEGMVDGILLFSLVYAESWTRRGREKSLEHLKNLLRISTDSVDSCCNSVLAELNRSLSLTCWSLPLVTVTSIAIAIPLAEGDKIKSQLLHGVAEGLKYARIIDKKLDSETMVNNRKATDIVWQGVDLGHQWLKVDLAALARKEKEAKKVIELLAEEGKSFATEFMGTANGLEWSPKALARWH